MPQDKPWGATPDEWFHFDLLLGRSNDLLPVVCNPQAPLSPDSKIKTLGKTPTQYNRHRQVVGLADWTRRQVSNADIERWSKERDYGICSRMGNGWLALDCDSESPVIQDAIHALLLAHFAVLPPRRYRDNSNKCLYLLAVAGDYRKRVYHLDENNGLIELLAAGQQAVIAGTHVSGARIKWDGGLPGEPLVMTPQQFESFWSALAEVLPVAVATEARAGRWRDRSKITPGATDDVADFLDANHWTLDCSANGARYIRCPFSEGHSGVSDVTSTVYFPAGTAGFTLGHFKCLHASCAHRNDGDYLNKIGFRDNDFDDISHPTDEGLPDINSDMTGHFLKRFLYVIQGDCVCDLSRPPYNCIMEMKAFKNLMAPYQFPAAGKGAPMPATKRWLEHPAKQVAESTRYQPGAGRLIIRPDGRFEVNEFYMPEHPPVTDTRKVSLLLDHLDYLLPDEWQRNFFIARLAWFVQRPERRCPITILHVATAHGTGRGWISQLMERVLGKWNCSRTRMKILCDNQFHDYLYHTLLCTIDEVRENTKRYEVNDKIRDVLTEPRFEVNSKYGKKMTIDIFTGFLFYTNHIDALVLPEEDRRIAVLGGPAVAAQEAHYTRLYAALDDNDFIAQIYSYLMSIDMTQFNWQRAPDTPQRRLMIASNKSELETEILRLLDNPPVPAMTYQQIVNEIIKELGLDAEINQKHITRILKERTQREPVRVKVNGVAQRFWLLEKNCEFSNEALRRIFDHCEKLQHQHGVGDSEVRSKISPVTR